MIMEPIRAFKDEDTDISALRTKLAELENKISQQSFTQERLINKVPVPKINISPSKVQKKEDFFSFTAENQTEKQRVIDSDTVSLSEFDTLRSKRETLQPSIVSYSSRGSSIERKQKSRTPKRVSIERESSLDKAEKQLRNLKENMKKLSRPKNDSEPESFSLRFKSKVFETKTKPNP